MGPPHIVPYFPTVIGYPPAVVGNTYIPTCRAIPMPQFLDSPAAVPLAQAEPEEPRSAYLREYRAWERTSIQP